MSAERPPRPVYVDRDDLYMLFCRELETGEFAKVDPIFYAALASGEIGTQPLPPEEIREQPGSKDYEECCVEYHIGDARKWLKRGTGTSKAGTKPKEDWEAIEEYLFAEIEDRGFPNPLNDEGWKTQADIARWIARQSVGGGLKVGDKITSRTTLNTHAKKMLDKWKAEQANSE